MSYRCRIRVLYCKKVAKMRYVYVVFALVYEQTYNWFLYFVFVFNSLNFRYFSLFSLRLYHFHCYCCVLSFGCRFSMEKIGILNSRWCFSLYNFHFRFANQAVYINLCNMWPLQLAFVLVCWLCHGRIFASLQWIWLMIMRQKLFSILCFISRFHGFFIQNVYLIFLRSNGAS